jgi:hypothetical protein
MNLEGIRTSIIFSIFLFGALTGKAQGQSLRNESWVSMGTTAKAIEGGSLVIQQAIGQRSVTGVFTNASIRLSQGFFFGGMSSIKEIKKPFAVIAFPNSFSERIRFRFAPEHSDQTLVLVFDEKGSLVYQTTQLPVANEVQLNLSFLASGVYIVHLRSGNKFVQTRIIKQP